MKQLRIIATICALTSLTALRSSAETGIASVFCDHRTASGEHMNCGAMVAAHRTLPFGSIVRVTNHNGGSCTVRIVDRGPWVRSRIIDLSPAAARACRVHGLARVTVG